MTLAWTNEGYWLTRTVFQRGLALVYLIAFLNAVNQFKPLLGEHGLLPVPVWVREVPFRASPSLFYFAPNDRAFSFAAWAGVALSVAALSGVAEWYAWLSPVLWALLWVLYLSFVNVGQTFYAFGWESILLEAGFYGIFLGSRSVAPQFPMILLLRWLCFRVMFGAGLIKLRGDPCWHDLTCLDYHYETQPMPNPLSWFLHWGPEWMHRGGVWFNHFAELVAPFGYFLPQPVASVAALVTIVFMLSIMISGNLSWLNLLTIVLAIPALDDRALRWLIPVRTPALAEPALAHRVIVAALCVLVVWMSVRPVRNMLSRRQIMNTAYNPLHLVGTYGAFGSITRVRFEIIVEGTDAPDITSGTRWREYEFRGKPGATGRMPPQVAPYHLRLDWLMWFAAMGDFQDYPWFVHFMGKLLEGDRATLSLLQTNPFPDAPPRYVRAQLYEYHFTSPGERARTGQWWRREFVRPYFPAVSLETAGFRRVLEMQGWMPAGR
ncbi:MAG TPA: lipase maturation factor family protein [Bryobacteraceae bacterium]|jgi:hypothetical protein|nr:lipase maturation factor family protein [Bryobacteraceae bacterium]